MSDGSAEILIASLRNLHVLVLTSDDAQRRWRLDPARCLREATDLLESRYVNNPALKGEEG